MDRDIGVYAATRILARTPEIVLLPIATVLSVISKSLARNEMREAADHQKSDARALVILLPTAAFAAVDAESILRLFFPESYYGGGLS
jgi:O-antigen/teichoic acid export membrane protein